jgi:hypothetical protein
LCPLYLKEQLLQAAVAAAVAAEGGVASYLKGFVDICKHNPIPPDFLSSYKFIPVQLLIQVLYLLSQLYHHQNFI